MSLIIYNWHKEEKNHDFCIRYPRLDYHADDLILDNFRKKQLDSNSNYWCLAGHEERTTKMVWRRQRSGAELSSFSSAGVSEVLKNWQGNTPKSLKSRKSSWTNEILKVNKGNSVKTWWGNSSHMFPLVPTALLWYSHLNSASWEMEAERELRDPIGSHVNQLTFCTGHNGDTAHCVIAHNVAKDFLKSYCFYPITIYISWLSSLFIW